MTWDGQQVGTGLFSDIMDAVGENARVLAVYDRDFYQGRAALIESRCGKGRVLHFGGTFTRDNTVRFLDDAGVLDPYRNLLSLPACCELAVKEKDGRRYLFVLNYTSQPQTVTLHVTATDMDNQTEVSGDVSIEAYGTRVYRI